MSRHVFPCSDDDCGFCEGQAEARADEESLSEGEIQQRENSYEAAMDAPW